MLLGKQIARPRVQSISTASFYHAVGVKRTRVQVTTNFHCIRKLLLTLSARFFVLE